jgi:hypothetical protein
MPGWHWGFGKAETFPLLIHEFFMLKEFLRFFTRRPWMKYREMLHAFSLFLLECDDDDDDESGEKN